MAATTPEPKPLLDLETLAPIDRPFIRIDGERYDLAVPGDFGLLELARLDRMNAEIDAIQKMAEELGPTERDTLPSELAERLERFIDDEVGLVLRAPPGVRAKLGSVQKIRIVEAFGAASRRGSAPIPKPNRATRRAKPTRTGARSSHGSRASSARSSG